jgi:HrpA-like RNA helicase
MQMRVFHKAPAGVRKVVVATNIAETSLTIDNIRFVVDSGFAKQSYFNPVTGTHTCPDLNELIVAFVNFEMIATGIECLVTGPISRANAQQRAGRAGRVKEGKCYRLMTEKSYLKLEVALALYLTSTVSHMLCAFSQPHSIPEMQRSDITSAVLQLKALGISDVAHFDYLSAPPVESMLFALELLYALQAIDASGKLTYMGT